MIKQQQQTVHKIDEAQRGAGDLYKTYFMIPM